MFSAAPPSHRERIKQLDAQYEHHTNQRHYLPFVYPWCSFGTYLVIAYLLVPHSKSAALRKARYAVWAINTVFAAYIIAHTRGRGAVAAYAVGFVMAWSIVWTTIVLVVHDGQVDFARIERASGSTGRVRLQGEETTPARLQGEETTPARLQGEETTPVRLKGEETTPARLQGEETTPVRLKGEETTPQPSGSLKRGQDESTLRNRSINEYDVGSKSTDGAEKDHAKGSELVWQHYPEQPFLERLDWVLDLMANFRGMAWNWRIPNLPSPPKEVVEQLSRHDDSRNSKIHHSKSININHTFLSRDVLLGRSFQRFTMGYFALDLIKILIIHDPFFWTGDLNLPGPSYLPSRLSASKTFMKSQRLLIAQLAVYWALQTIFQTASLFFVGILGSDRIGVRGQHWMYPAEWGTYTTILNRGLSGWWGTWWHQTFRFAFESPGTKLIKQLNMNPRSLPAKTLQMFIAFSISGFLHANASHTSIGPTNPLQGPFLFFSLQPLGLIAQTLSSHFLKEKGITRHMPIPIRQLINFVYVHVWFYYTAPLFVNDAAAGGQFLYEPIPFSVLRGLGLGTEEESWYCWGGRWPGFYRGRYWWESGIVT
ncbi:hypothetical protein E2P81_ATG06892 [Venturia nashicola]|uniref:Wax synthase domain-containing protein n=1 Tax=Venturia nashicola TaxID=86259 RepID=A0A4Z1NV24_9PEZI|nr:hypothetical protein E6O75_ATG07062 [Venturia nashicola]TLD30239.1 hypothetical protein E2P81_ATG06892 [Venturia nashicola]